MATTDKLIRPARGQIRGWKLAPIGARVDCPPTIMPRPPEEGDGISGRNTRSMCRGPVPATAPTPRRPLPGTAPIQKPPSGNFYHAGEYCPQVDAGKTTQNSAGRGLVGQYNSGLRWQYA